MVVDISAEERAVTITSQAWRLILVRQFHAPEMFGRQRKHASLVLPYYYTQYMYVRLPKSMTLRSNVKTLVAIHLDVACLVEPSMTVEVLGGRDSTASRIAGSTGVPLNLVRQVTQVLTSN